MSPFWSDVLCKASIICYPLQKIKANALLCFLPCFLSHCSYSVVFSALLSLCFLCQSALPHPFSYHVSFRHSLRDFHRFADIFLRREVPVLCQQIRKHAQRVGVKSRAEYWRLGMAQWACSNINQGEDINGLPFSPLQYIDNGS